jgi:hypothetical protein
VAEAIKEHRLAYLDGDVEMAAVLGDPPDDARRVRTGLYPGGDCQ